AEDGIRDFHVTGVQTCALPICMNTVIEDYVKTIYHHTEWQPEPITPSVLATRLGLAASSVTEMVKKLAASGLVTHVPYGAITLKIGRASCRERGQTSRAAGTTK